MYRVDINHRKIVWGLVIVFSGLLFLNSSVYAEWIVVNPPNVSSNWWLTGVFFTSPNEGWAIGNDTSNNRGVFLHYQNGTWTSVIPPYISSSWYIGDYYSGGGPHFTSPNDGWAVGFNDMGGDLLLFHYFNGSWAPIMHAYMHENWWFKDVYFTSSNEGWIVGEGFFSNEDRDRGIILHYLNGTLTAIDPPAGSSGDWILYDVYFISPNEGWAVGWDWKYEVYNNVRYGYLNKGILLHYLNGSWFNITLPYVSSSWALSSVHFTSANEGWAVGEDDDNFRGVLLYYSNGSWTATFAPAIGDYWLSNVYFTSPEEGWAVGGDSYNGINNLKGVLLYYSGGSWAPVSLPYVSENWELNSVYFTLPNEGWVVGRDIANKRGIILKFSETISPPTTLSGAITGMVGKSYTYSAGGAFSSSGDPVQYLFDWGDGTNSGWLPVGTTSASHSWGSAGTYPMKVQARCAAYTDVVSSWSSSLSVTITVPSTVTTNPSGLQIIVDSSTFTAPQTFDWTPGSSHTLSVPSPQTGTSGTRYIYSSWSDGGAQTHIVTAPSSNTTYTATFSTQYELMIISSPLGGGTVTPSPMGDQSGMACVALVGVVCAGYYSIGTLVTLTATPNPGNSFGSWSGDLSGTANPTSFTINGPKNVVANFTQDQYTLTVTITPPGSGSVTKSPDKATYVYGDTVQLTATANPGDTFSNWSGDFTGSTNPTTITMNGNKTITANFATTSVTPKAYDFGNVKVKRSKTASFVVKNSGKANLSITSAIKGTDASMFKITSGGGSKRIKPGKSLTVKVAFKPTSKGSKSGNLEITSNDPVAPTIDIPLSGTGQ